jgi:hypothetical protein
MTIDFENPNLMFKLTKYYGEMEDGRTFAIVVRSTDSYDWAFTDNAVSRIVAAELYVAVIMEMCMEQSAIFACVVPYMKPGRYADQYIT